MSETGTASGWAGPSPTSPGPSGSGESDRARRERLMDESARARRDRLNRDATQMLDAMCRGQRTARLGWRLSERAAGVMTTSDGTAAATVQIVPRWRGL